MNVDMPTDVGTCIYIYSYRFIKIKINMTLFYINKDKNRGFAFVEFADPDDAEHAMDNMNDAEFYGKVLRVNYARQYGLNAGTASMFDIILVLCFLIIFISFL